MSDEITTTTTTAATSQEVDSPPADVSTDEPAVSASKPPKPPRKRVIKKPSVAKSKEVKAVPKASVKREEEERTRIRVKIMAYDHKVIDKTTKIIIETARRSGAETVGPIPLPTNIKKFTLLRSTFVHKDARDQYEIRTHKRLIDIYDPTQKTIEDLTNLSLPAGVDIEIKM